MVSQIVGHYRIVRKIGEGGMGIVYEAWDGRLGRAVAIKTILAKDGREEALKRLWQEARSLARVSHPNVCQLFDAYEDGATLFLVLELLEGQSLAARLVAGPVDVAETSHIVGQILAALDALHAHGIVHRDLKPSNVFLTPHGVKLLDFGLALSTRSSPAAGDDGGATLTAITRPGVILGTPHYMSPEQAAGEAAGPASDIFAAGSILYEMLSGSRPFEGKSLVDILYRVMHHEPPPLAGTREMRSLDAVIRRALAKRPHDRFGSAGEMAQALRAALTAPAPVSVTARATRLIVLPFRTLRKDEETEFLAYSLPDAISNSLSGLDSLTVRSTLVAQRFEGQAADPKKIAAEADVDAILTGSLLRVGAQLRFSCQLLAAPAGTVIWSDTLHVSMQDLFQVQDGLTTQIVRSLMLPLTEREHHILRRDVPRTARVYEYYLRANQLAEHRSVENMKLARDLYLQCIDEDPDYAPAWARLGRAHRFIAKFSGETNQQDLKLVDQEFRRAFTLNPDLALAHNLYTAIECEQGAALDAMIRLLERARYRRHDPDLFAGLVQACRYCDELEASVTAWHCARQLDPHVVTSAEHTFFLLGDYCKTLSFYDNQLGYYLDAAALAALNSNGEALERLCRRAESGRVVGGLVSVAMNSLRAYLQGDYAQCRAIIPEIETLVHQDPETLFYLARHLARIDEPERAVAALQKALDSGFLCASSMARDPWLASLRAFPAFEDLAQKAERSRLEVHAAFLNAGGEQVLEEIAQQVV